MTPAQLDSLLETHTRMHQQQASKQRGAGSDLLALAGGGNR